MSSYSIHIIADIYSKSPYNLIQISMINTNNEVKSIAMDVENCEDTGDLEQSNTSSSASTGGWCTHTGQSQIIPYKNLRSTHM